MLTKKEYNLKHPKKRKPSGTLKIDDIQLLKKYTYVFPNLELIFRFMDYLFGGCEISLIVSIDLYVYILSFIYKVLHPMEM